MKHSREKSEPQQLYRAWNNCGFNGYVMASSTGEAKRILLAQMGVTMRKAFIFNVEPVYGVFLIEIE